MKKIFLPVFALAALLAGPAYADLVSVPSPIGVWNNSTGALYGFNPGGGGATTTVIPVFNSNGGQTIGAGYASTTPPANGLIVQGNVGIGSTTPAVKLDVVGAVSATGNLAINTNKFTVAASSGNTLVAGTLNSTGLITATAGVTSADNLTMSVAAKGLVLKQGANGRAGTFTCTSGGTIVVSNSSYAITDTVGASLNTLGGSITAAPFVIANSAGVSFSMKCATSDTSVYNYTLTANAP